MTKGDLDRLGERIGESNRIKQEDLDLLQQYRTTFQEPIARVFNYLLKTARKIDKQSIVTYRIKRIDTIIEKLRRFRDNKNGNMQLSRMGDIAGCRCIMTSSSEEKLYSLLDAIKKEYGENCKVNDYVLKPKDSGYRSIHIYVKDHESQKPVEIQIRNKAHHNWATLVEIVDLLYGSRYKELGSSKGLGHFLLLFSKAQDLTEDEFSEMLKQERKMKVFEKMSDIIIGNYLNIRLQWLKQKTRGSYYVITAKRTGSQILSFQNFSEAETAYYEKYLQNKDSNIVLTHLRNPDFNQISMAYSNYVLAMHAFFDDYRVLVSQHIIKCVGGSDYFHIIRDFKIYNDNLKSHFRNLALEINSIDVCRIDPTISRHQLNKWQGEIKDRLLTWQRETKGFIALLANSTRGSFIKKWVVRNCISRMARAIKAGQRIN